MGLILNDSYTEDGVQIMPTPVRGNPSVTPGGPAAKAGLKPGDVITKMGDVKITDTSAFMSTIWSHHPGQQVKVQYVRNGENGTAIIELGQKQGDTS